MLWQVGLRPTSEASIFFLRETEIPSSYEVTVSKFLAADLELNLGAKNSI